MRSGIFAVLLLGLSACASMNRPGTDARPEATDAMVQVFDHVRVHRTRQFVEFDGIIMWEFHDPQTPDTYLEQIVCTPDTKEHESLVVSLARPSAVHAALLLVGVQPGQPGSWRIRNGRLVPDPPVGDPLIVRFVTADGVEHDPLTWIIDGTRTRTMREHMGNAPAFVFGGSRFVNFNGRDVYDADYSGTLVGLTTFGGETISFREVISHEASIQPPQWLAFNERLPEVGEPVVVRIYPVRSTQAR